MICIDTAADAAAAAAAPAAAASAAAELWSSLVNSGLDPSKPVLWLLEGFIGRCYNKPGPKPYHAWFYIRFMLV
jgi:hypothetical protein